MSKPRFAADLFRLISPLVPSNVAGMIGLCVMLTFGTGFPVGAKPESGNFGAIMDRLAEADQTYLGLTYETMRQQLAADDLDAAERTLGWILRISPDDEMAAVLSAELQLRRGNVAIAAMRLLDIVELPATGEAARLEAERILASLRKPVGGDVLRLSDAAQFVVEDLPPPINPVSIQLPQTGTDGGRYGYAVVSNTPTQAQIDSLQSFAKTRPFDDSEFVIASAGLEDGQSGFTPLLIQPDSADMAPASNDSADSVLQNQASAPASETQLAAAISPPPNVPEDGQLLDSQASGGQPDLIDLLFSDPGNLQLNFAVFQEQVAANDLDGAAATLERVLLIDPQSKLAKVLLADVNLRKGNLLVARNILLTLLDEEDTPEDMAERADTLLAQVEQQLDPTKIQTRVVMEIGNTENAFGRAKADEILFLNLPLTNTTPDKSDVYGSYSVSSKVLRELNRQTPTLLEAGVSVTGRDTRHKSLSDLRTYAFNASLTERAMINKSVGVFASASRLNHRSFNRNAGLFFAVTMPVAMGWELNQSVSASRSTYATYPGLANNTGRSDRSFVAKMGLGRQFERAFVNLALSAGRSKARNKIYDRKFTKAELTVAGMMGDFSLTGIMSRQWTRNDHADPFVSPLKAKQRQDSSSLKVQYPRGGNVGGLFFVPYIRMTSSSTEANIPNNRREGSEAAIGIETVF